MSTDVTMDRPATRQMPSYEAIRDFLYYEGRLLDEQRWREWADLFTEDGDYWVPATPGQPDPLNHVSLIYENPLQREVRIRRFENPQAHSLQPFPRSSHLISNVMVDHVDAEAGEVVTNARFMMVTYRKEVRTVHAGAMTHTLQIDTEGSMRIRRKRVDLVDCDAAHETINLYF